MKKKQPVCSVIIVTYNSQIHLPKAMACLNKQSRPADQIILVDTGSSSYNYLETFREQSNVHIVTAEKNSGFCKGNNIGFNKVRPDCDYVFLLNPDAFLTFSYLEEAIAFLENPENANYGALTGTTLGYDINVDQPTGKYDTTGVFKTWYGKWYDRHQGDSLSTANYKTNEDLPAICGAVFFCRKQALDAVLIRGHEILDQSFYMYKEDIDLSLRLRAKGWKLAFVPQLIAYHCRGWNPDRTKMPRRMRLCSARNELRLQTRQLSPIGLLYSGLKFTLVKFLDI
jgi:GT2 family glycosyltransferase